MTESDQTAEPNRPVAAKGCGPNTGMAFSQEDYHHPSAGWGAATSVGLVLLRQRLLIDGTRVVFKMNHENEGYDCPGCAWPDDLHGLIMDDVVPAAGRLILGTVRSLDVTSFAKHGSTREVRGYRALPYNLPQGNAMGYMPELNARCAIGDYNHQSDQPLMKRIVVEVPPARTLTSSRRGG